MGGPIRIEVLAAEVKARMDFILRHGGDLTPAFEVVGRTLLTRIQMGFRNSQAPDGSGWLPIKFRAPRVKVRAVKKGGKTEYVQRRDKDGNLIYTKAGAEQAKANASGNAGKPLIDTGRLRKSITYEAGPRGVVIGTNVKYARTHQFGAEIKAKNKPFLAFPGPNGELIIVKRVTIPARPFMPLNQTGTQVALPPAWSKSVLRALGRHLGIIADGGAPSAAAS